jgi:hypothetical protein
MSRNLVVEYFFPRLRKANYWTTSAVDYRYNCIAWAHRNTKQWWWPGGPYWPTMGPLDSSPAAFVAAFRTLGFEPCSSKEVEHGYEKIALFANSRGETTHAARQLLDGRWTSKLGKGFDIIHDLEDVGGPDPAYGEVVQILRKSL